MRDIISYGAKEPGNIARNQKDCPRTKKQPLFMEMLTAIAIVVKKDKQSWKNQTTELTNRRHRDATTTAENTVWNKFYGREKKNKKSKEGEVADSQLLMRINGSPAIANSANFYAWPIPEMKRSD